MPVVSLYDSYGKDSIKYVMSHSDIKCIFIDTYARALNIMEVVDSLPELRMVVYFNSFSEKELQKLNELNTNNNIEIYSLDEFIEIGRNDLKPHHPPKALDIATICYTSGTTGFPKGAMITHRNMMAVEAAVYDRFNWPSLNYSWEKPKPTLIAYLPLAHMMGRLSLMATLMNGGRAGFPTGDRLKLRNDIKDLKPTDCVFVPRLLNRLFDQAMVKVSGSRLKSFLLRKAIESKSADIKKGVYRRNTIYDYLIFNKLREVFGGEIIRAVTGSAPLADDVMLFCRAAFGCSIPEGYGQTESSGIITLCHPLDPHSIGNCGPPLACNMVKLVDVPEMGYFSANDQGEICAKGQNVFRGYLKDPVKTAETIDEDGWLHTGDIGQWTQNGSLKIIDRKKNLFKLSQGEYISPEKIESIYSRSPFIDQIIIEGDSLQDSVVAIVVPDFSYIEEFIKNDQRVGKIDSNIEMCEHSIIRQIVFDDMKSIAKSSGLMSYEQVKSIYLFSEPFSLENGLATPTMKVKRNEVRNYFKKQINEMYEELAQIKKAKANK
jgi:long-chain acyl-CoA synthetase